MVLYHETTTLPGRSGEPTTSEKRTSRDDMETPSPSSTGGVEVPVQVGPPRSSGAPHGRESRGRANPLVSKRTPRGEHVALVCGSAEGVDWKVGIFLSDGALLPLFEFSRPVPHDHVAVKEAYAGLLNCVQKVLGEAWSEKTMCPSCHLPTSTPEACECCDQKMCGVCRARHFRGQGVPGTLEPTGRAEDGTSEDGSGPSIQTKHLPGYG